MVGMAAGELNDRLEVTQVLVMIIVGVCCAFFTQSLAADF